MIYYNPEIKKLLQKKNGVIDDILRKHLGDGHKYGIAEVITTPQTTHIEQIVIDKISDYSVNGATWTHYASIIRGEDGWTLEEFYIPIDEKFCKKWGDEYRQWIGTQQTAVNVYCTRKYLASLMKDLMKNGTSANCRKAKSVWV